MEEADTLTKNVFFAHLQDLSEQLSIIPLIFGSNRTQKTGASGAPGALAPVVCVFFC